MRNMPLYIRVLAAVAREPKSATAVNVELGLAARGTASSNALRMMRGRLVRVVGYRPGRGAAALWLLGADGDAVPPRERQCFRRPGPEMAAFLALMEAMGREPQSMKQLQDLSGSTRGTVMHVLRLGRKLGVIHIAEWDRERRAGAWAPHYALAVDRPDQTRPKATPRRVIEQRYWDARRAREAQGRVTHALAGSMFAMGAA